MYSGVYIGEFPPGYGGVTVKNSLLYNYVFSQRDIKAIDMIECKRTPWKIPFIACQVAYYMIKCDNVIIGVGSPKRRKILLTFQRMISGCAGLKKIMMIVMGGQFHEYAAEDARLRRLLAGTGSIWVESESMIRAFREMNIPQTYFFPNCRVNQGTKEPGPSAEGKLKTVFFSRICIEKGVEDIIAAYKLLGEVAGEITFDFYGEMEDDIREEFLQFVESHENVHYHGVFDAVNGDVYTELNKFDVMLLISKREGISGTLVESKMAGITAVVSDRGFNAETVKDGTEGVVIAAPYAENLADTLSKLSGDRDELQRLKLGSYESRKRYCVETYRETLLESIVP